MHLTRFVFAVVLSIFASTSGQLAAQVVTEPASPVPGSGVITIDVAATYAGSFFLYETGAATLYVRRVPLDAPAGVPVIVNAGETAAVPAIAPLVGGGFTIAWRRTNDILARFLDVGGAPAGTTFRQSEDFANSGVRLASIAAGTVIVWSESGGGGLTLNAQVGFQRYVLDGYTTEAEVATTPTGGCVIVWRRFVGADRSVRAQMFDANGFPLAAPATIAVSDVTISGVAVDPTSGVGAIVGMRGTPTAHLYEVRVFRFAADGAPLGPELMVDSVLTASAQTPYWIVPAVGFDFGGNLYVVWGDDAAATAGVRARAFGPDGTPFGPSVAVAPQVPSQPVRTVLRPDGRFVNAWVRGRAAYTNVVSLCVPGSATCGDGVLVGACERCDAGAANDDAAADACRTTCLPAHCGDGTVDTGEQCDDGNFEGCDGCGPTCATEALAVCGDGTTSTVCGEQCDDGNGALLDGCTPACRLERVPGGGSPKTDCLIEWTIDNATTVPPYDKHGGINAKQSCVDDDPRCDRDGGTPGSCTFHVRVCGNNTNGVACPAPGRLAAWTLDRPSASQGVQRPWLAAIRSTMSAAVPGAIIGPVEPDVCSDEVAITVPLRGAPGHYKPERAKLQSSADAYDGRRDKDRLNLECRPAGP